MSPRKLDCRHASIDDVMLGEGVYVRTEDLAQDLQSERHFLPKVGVQGGAQREMQSDLVTKTMNLTYLADDRPVQNTIELAVDQYVECGYHADGVLELGHV